MAKENLLKSKTTCLCVKFGHGKNGFAI